MDMPHWEPRNHVGMPLICRAAQFNPFDPLEGYEEAVTETARETDDKRFLDEEGISAINRRLIELQANDDVSILYFDPDKKKIGGAYRTVIGKIKKIDTYEENVVLTDGAKIPMRQIMAIE